MLADVDSYLPPDIVRFFAHANASGSKGSDVPLERLCGEDKPKSRFAFSKLSAASFCLISGNSDTNASMALNELRLSSSFALSLSVSLEPNLCMRTKSKALHSLPPAGSVP